MNEGKIKLFKGLSSKERASNIIFLVMILFVLIIDTICFVNAIRWVNKPFAGFLLNQRMILGDVGQYNWTGTKVGLKYPDKILKANGRTISSMKDLEDLLKNTKVGDPITYAVNRHGEIREMTVQTMLFTFRDLLMTFGVTFFPGIIYLLIGVVVFILKPCTKVSWVFLLLCFSLSIYTATVFDVVATHCGFIRLYFFVQTFFPAIFVHLSFFFPQKTRFIQKYPFFEWIPYMVSAILVIFVEYFYPAGSLYEFTYQLVLVYIVIAAIAILTSTLYAYFRGSSGLSKLRAKVVLIGASLAFPIPAIGMLLPIVGGSLFKEMNIQANFLAVPLMIFPASISYAIARHNLFDVDVYVKRAVGYGIMTAIVGLTYFSLQVGVRSTFQPVFGEHAEKIYPILFAVLVVFLFNPLNRTIQTAVDKLFYRKKFDYKETVISVSNALTSVLNLTEVIKRIINTVRKEMFIDTAGVILLEPQKRECQTLFISDSSDKGGDQVKDICIPYDDPLFSLLSKEKKLITTYDITEDPHYSTVREPGSQRFAEMGASILFPFISQGEVKGALALGYKKSGHFYTREDIDLLNTLANNGAVAIENARLAEQMKKEETVRTNLARYLSPQIVDQIITKDVQVNLGGDRKVVTVLFSDIRNFTTITETRPPDQLVQILNEYFTEMASIIFENQGSLDKYIGDAIVAVFGSLIPLENSANNAVHAAIQMMKQLPILNEKWMKQYGFSMDIGIGINTGEVFLGNIGSPERMEFTVIGDTVNVASRFSGLARPGQILITKDTVACLGSDMRYKELPPSEVKGKTGKMEVFEIPYS